MSPSQRSRFHGLGLSFVAGIALSACGTGAATSDRLGSVESLTGDSTTGQGLYASNCAVCHGASGQGGSGPRLSSADETQTIDAMLSGPSQMPTFTSLSDQNLADLAAYVVAMP